LTTSNPNTFSQSFVPNVAASSSPQNSLSSLNPLFTFYGSQSPQFSSQSAPTSTSFPSSAAAAANNGNVAASSLISSENPTYQPVSSSVQNNQFVATTLNTQNIPMMVKSGPSQTNTPQVPSFGSTKSLTLTPQISQLLFKGGNPPSTSSNTNVNPPSRTNSPSQNTQTFNVNQDILGTSSLSNPQSGNTPSDINSNSVSTSSSSSTPASPSVNQDINPFSYCAKFNPKTLLCEQCAKGFRVNPRFNKTNPNQVPYCLALDPLCKTYSTDLSRCATCYVGYEISNNTCVVSKTALANC